MSNHPARWRILGVLGIAQLMLILDVTVVAVALPQMEADLGLSREALTWTVSAYTLTFGGLLLLGGRLVDLRGAKPVALGGLTLFTLASLATGLAQTSEALVAGRIAQGLGAALLSPAALSLVVTLFDGEERGRALGIWSALGGAGSAIGVLAGGLLAAGPGWRWVFFVNVPIGVATVISLVVLLPATLRPGARPRLDVLGAVLVTASSATLIYALISAGERGWLSIVTVGLVLAAAVGYVLFVLWQRASAAPLMDVRLLIRRPVATGVLHITLATALMIVVFFLGTFYFQNTLGYGPLATGLLFLPVALATMLSATLAGRLIARLGARRLGVTALVLAAAGMAVPALALGPVTAVVGVVVAAAGTGAMFVVASATALGQVAPEEAGVASGIVSTFHEFGASVGAAAISSIAAASLVGGTLDGYQRGFAAAAVGALVAAGVAIVLTPARRPDAAPAR
ncbi:MFS transporter [Pseudonocardia sp. CA-107938]|uniref:MFS transporter n=1 Tax=Pseudonocardia sp. CA-107938 TaxID=3240021 RepID=UPI003D8AC89C